MNSEKFDQFVEIFSDIYVAHSLVYAIYQEIVLVRNVS